MPTGGGRTGNGRCRVSEVRPGGSPVGWHHLVVCICTLSQPIVTVPAGTIDSDEVPIHRW